jgi:hypothetical protein
MSKVFLSWYSNWADEMDVEGTAIMDKKDWEDYRETVSKINKSFYLYIGTNEEIEYSSGDELLNEITVKPMTDEEADTIRKFVGSESGFTQFLGADDYANEDEDYDDEDYDDEE